MKHHTYGIYFHAAAEELIAVEEVFDEESMTSEMNSVKVNFEADVKMGAKLGHGAFGDGEN